MQTIKKFQIGRSYYHPSKTILFHILERDGKGLKVDVVRPSRTERYFVETNLAADENGAYEWFFFEDMKIKSINILPQAREVSEEEDKRITEAIKQDIEFRKKNKFDTANITTEHKIIKEE